MLNIVERYLVSLANKKEEKELCGFWISIDHDLLQKAEDEIKSKKSLNFITREAFVGAFEDSIAHSKVHTPDHDALKVTVLEDVPGMVITCKSYTKVIPRDIHQTLKLMYNAEPENYNCKLATMLMQLSSLVVGGQQWSMPKSWYQNIATRFGTISLIPFASPVNVARAKQVCPTLNYCSLFPADAAFGSLGAFDMRKIIPIMKTCIERDPQPEGTPFVIAMNPPFIETILADAANAAIQMVEAGNMLDRHVICFFIGPGWRDSDFYKILSRTSTRIPFNKKVHIKSNAHYYEDSTKQPDLAKIKISSGYGSFVFMLSNRKMEVSDGAITFGFSL